jgi:hypothetical protein
MKAPNTASLAVSATVKPSEVVDANLLSEIVQGDIAPITQIAPVVAPVVPLVETPVVPTPELAPEPAPQEARTGNGETSGPDFEIRPCDLHIMAGEGDMLLVRHIPTSKETEMSRAELKRLLRG